MPCARRVWTLHTQRPLTPGLSPPLLIGDDGSMETAVTCLCPSVRTEWGPRGGLEDLRLRLGRHRPPPSLCTPASPPAPPAPSPAAGGPSLGTLGPVQPVVGPCAGARSPQPGVAGARWPAPGAAGYAPALPSGPGGNPRCLTAHPGLGCTEAQGVQVALLSLCGYRPSPGPAGGLGVLHTRLTSGPCLGWNPAHRPRK